MFIFDSGFSPMALSPPFPKPPSFYSRTSGWFIPPAPSFNSQKHLFLDQTTVTTEPIDSTTMQPRVDLELKLGQHGCTTGEVMTSTRFLGVTIPKPRVPKKLLLTLGHPTWAKTYKKKGRTAGTPTQGAAGPSGTRPRKRDQYGPCVRCGTVFDTSQTYASHMRIHYLREDTEEERKERLAKRRRQ